MLLKKLSLLLLFTLTFLACAIADKGYKIDVKVNGVQDSLAYLAYHYGNRQYVQDTVQMDSDGRFSFSGPEVLDRGMYMIVLPGQVYFEILVDDNQHFGIETTMDDFVSTMSFTNSPDNEVFYDYMRFIRTQSEQIRPLRDELQKQDTSEERKAQIREKLKEFDENVKGKQDKIIDDQPQALFSRILLAQQEPVIPEQRLKPDGTPDQEYMYRYYKNNFWTNINLTDDRLVRTPLFHAKLNQYFTQVVIQIPDSIIKETDNFIGKIKDNPELFKYTVFFITNTFEKSQIMGMDAVFVHMVEKYYLSGEADWVTTEQLQTIGERAAALAPILIGKVAPDISMVTRDRKRVNLHSIEADYTILYFWDSECSHCKRNTPILKEFYERMHSKGVEIFSVNTESETESWIKYLDDNELNDWVNVVDTMNLSGFRDKYDIWATPLLFVLDKDKKIIAKKLSVEQAEEVINFELSRTEN